MTTNDIKTLYYNGDIEDYIEIVQYKKNKFKFRIYHYPFWSSSADEKSFCKIYIFNNGTGWVEIESNKSLSICMARPRYSDKALTEDEMKKDIGRIREVFEDYIKMVFLMEG